MNTRAVRNIRRLVLTFGMLAGVAATFAGSFDFPKRKPGEWQITISPSRPGYPPKVENVCLDRATDAMLYQVGVGASQKLCTESKWVRVGKDRIVADLTCKLGTTQSRVHAELTLHGDSGYHQDITTHYDPPLYGKSELQSSQEARWLGACPADMKPGDVVVQPSPMMPIRMRMNLNDMLRQGR